MESRLLKNNNSNNNNLKKKEERMSIIFIDDFSCQFYLIYSNKNKKKISFEITKIIKNKK